MKPLIIRGARQVGKTSTVRALAKACFENCVEINFEQELSLHKIFEPDLDAKRILREIETIKGIPISPEKTLLFLDEIQACPKAITSLRYFYEEIPTLRVIAAGSLLEFALGQASVPVGRVTYEYMYPLSFGEFLGALGEDKLIPSLPTLKSIQQGNFSLPPAISEKLRSRLREYFVVGGMPEAVLRYIENGSFLSVNEVLDDLIQTFRDDTRKYTQGELQLSNVNLILERAFTYVGRQVKYTVIGQGDTIARTKHSLSLLEQAMLIHRVRSASPDGLPLGAGASEKFFRCIFLDIGLGQRLSGMNPKEILTSDNLLVTYHGALADQFVGQQLLAESSQASEGRSLYCWIRPEKSSTAEVDYLIAREGQIYPIEVKSGPSGRLKSLHLYLKTFGGCGFCLQDTDKITKNDVTFSPLYTVLDL